MSGNAETTGALRVHIRSPIVAPIAAHLAEWETPHVELAIHETRDAARIAKALEDYCRTQLNSGIERTLFYQSSIGAVAGLELTDGRQVVIKAHQSDWTFERLQEIVFLQSRVAETLALAPRVLAAPAKLGKGFATAEQYVDRGTIGNGHDPLTRRSLAASLHAVTRCLAPFVAGSRLPSGLLTSPPTDRLWPTPHSKLFDFQATAKGAEYIDEIAAVARRCMHAVGPWVIAHSDWRAEHVRFEGDSPTVAFDWDSLHVEREAAIVGMTAHMHCSDFIRTDIAQAPTLDEAREFVSDYERAAGRQLNRKERALCGATFAYSIAYTSRCVHAGGVDLRETSGTFPNLLATEGLRLLEL